MLRRLLVGLILGVAMGALVAAVLIKGLGVLTFDFGGGAALAYLAAAVTGALAGLVAGKPVWAKGAWIEVGLKAFFGALLAAGAMFALRQWVGFQFDLTSIGAGAGLVGQLPAVSLPIIATLLSVFYELDNTDAPDEDGAKKGAKSATAPGKRVSTVQAKGSGRAASERDAEDEDAGESKKMTK